MSVPCLVQYELEKKKYSRQKVRVAKSSTFPLLELIAPRTFYLDSLLPGLHTLDPPYFLFEKKGGGG